jgi:tetratricopeptide (TPR) repeat protein
MTMDGRRKLVLAGCFLASAVGCNTTPKQPTTVAQTPAFTSAQPTKTYPPAEPTRSNLKPSTYVSMGGLTEQAADEQDRPATEREALRRQARQSYQKALQVDPKYAPAYVALGESYLNGGEREQAQEMFKKAIEIAPNDAGLWAELGAAQAKAKDWPNAVASLSRAVQLDPSNKPMEQRLGFTQARAGQYEDALNTLAKCMSEAEARYNVARMMKHNGQTDAADQQLQLALKANPEFDAARQMLMDGGPIADGGIQQASYHQPSPRQPPVQLGGAQ